MALTTTLLLSSRLVYAQTAYRAPAKSGGGPIVSVTENASRYSPGQPVQFAVSVTAGAVRAQGTLRLQMSDLGRAVFTTNPVAVNVAPGRTFKAHINWSAPAADFTGYLVTATLQHGRQLERATTAVDVSSTWTRYPRYGFLSGYGRRAGDTAAATIQHLTDYHINSLQFYDWQYRHEEPVKFHDGRPVASWKDIAGRSSYRRTVMQYIADAHSRGIACMNYNLIYGGWADYATLGVLPAWGVYHDAQAKNQVKLPMPHGWATSAICLFNPANPGWQNWLLNQEKQAFHAYPFDGWQADQVGNPGDIYSADGKQVTMWKTFAPFLATARKSLNRAIVFNNVAAYGLYDTAANSHEDVVYIECWAPAQHTYQQLQDVINNAHLWSHGKAVILAAYMDRKASNQPSGRSPQMFNTPGVLLADAAIFASGASHIELGDDVRLLSNEYFPNANLVASTKLLAELKRWYTFLTAYEAVLQSGAQVAPVHLAITGCTVSAKATPGTVWAFGARGDNWRTVQLVNLQQATSDAWRDNSRTCAAPGPTGPLSVRIYTDDQNVTEVLIGSPDTPTGTLHPLHVVHGGTAADPWITVTIPNLTYWDMLLLKGNHTKSAVASSGR